MTSFARNEYGSVIEVPDGYYVEADDKGRAQVVRYRPEHPIIDATWTAIDDESAPDVKIVGFDERPGNATWLIISAIEGDERPLLDTFERATLNLSVNPDEFVKAYRRRDDTDDAISQVRTTLAQVVTRMGGDF